MIPRSWLFAPGDSPAKMQKACASGADAVILDLEDSVAETRKAEARAAVADFVRARGGSPGPELWVRINPLGSSHAAADIEAAASAGTAGIVLPKCDNSDEVQALAARLERIEHGAGLAPSGLRILPIATETPKSVFGLGSYIHAGPRLAGLTWGAEDLSSAIGALSPRDEEGELTGPYLLVRSLCLFAAVAADAPAIETVYPDFRDLAGLGRYVARGRRDGFLGMMAIHPAQVAVINAGFTPTDAELDHARRVVSLFAANPGAATLALDGRMLDRPHLLQATRTLQRAGSPAN